MAIPRSAYPAPFNTTRASHVILTVRDLGASRAFYCDALGFAISDQDREALYLRGIEEACHHSLVLRQSADAPVCERIGLRVYTENDLDTAKHYFERARLPAAFVEAPHQGRTLQICDAVGTPLEFCASMAVEPRLVVQFPQHKGACPQRIDHSRFSRPMCRACANSIARWDFVSRNSSPRTGPTISCSSFCNAREIPTTSCSSTAPDRGCITPHSACRTQTTSSMPATWRAAWASAPISNTAPAAMAPGLRSWPIFAIPTGIAWSCSTPITRSWISRTSRCAGSRRPAAAFLGLAAAPEMVSGGIALLRRCAARRRAPAIR